MKKLSLVTGLVCLTGLTTYTQAKTEEVPTSKKIQNEQELCSNDGKIIGKRYIARHKGKKYLACCKECAAELLERLDSTC